MSTLPLTIQIPADDANLLPAGGEVALTAGVAALYQRLSGFSGEVVTSSRALAELAPAAPPTPPLPTTAELVAEIEAADKREEVFLALAVLIAGEL